MRLEHLRIAAFGPFADTVEIDFTELSDAGLFLLTGATGAGKSSVLDAVCFALYGVVPGDRSDAKHLRSDHAAPGVAPEVELRATVRGRAFRFRRTAQWERPKKRGVGTARQQPTVCIEELRDDAWQPLATRMDEAGHLVTDLLGMTATQFTQVAMLPQGRFQAFLRASSTERHAVLQRLFRTDRFERIEHWLADHRRALRRDSDVHADAVRALVQRISEVADEPVPEELAGEAADPGDATLTAWAMDRLEGASTVLEGARAEAAAAAHAHDAASLAHTAALEQDKARRRALEARAVLTVLDESADEAAQQERALAAHRRAAPLRTLLARAADARRKHADARAPLPSLTAAAGLDAAEPAEVAALLGAALDEVATARAALPLEDRVDAAGAELRVLGETHDALDAEVDRLRAEVDTLPASVRELEESHTAATTACARLDGLRAELARSTAGLEAATRVVRLVDDEAATKLALQERTEEALVLRDAYLDAREARINAMAGELAGGLAVGCSCPVCGSVEHPSPARATGGAGKSEEEAAQRAYETADTARLATAEVLAGVSAQLASARAAAADLDSDAWRSLVDDARSTLAATEELAGARDEIDASLTTTRSRLAEATARLDAARTDHAAAVAAHAAALRAHEALLAEVDAARGGFAHVTARVEAADAHRDRLKALADALAVAESACERLARIDEDLAAASSAAGFDDAEAAAAALLPDTVAERAEELLGERDRRAAAARAVLDEPEVRAATSADAPDLDTFAAALTAAATERRAADETLARAARAHTRLQALVGELTAALAAWAPVQQAWRVAAGVSALAEGTSTDNALKMRLSAYVLSERLRQVVAAANTRLARMTDSRYSLEHTDERTVGAKRGGLGLWVRDDWTGARRDPATLSGGETFVVSLALALGLADTVTHEAGGTEIDTLFIDEGFGSLDSDTLDDVMDTLDSLREGGRVVGVVSHVPEMRERIPAGIDVVKARTGSRLSVR